MNQHGSFRERARAVYGIERLQNFKRQLQNDYLLDGPLIFDAGAGRKLEEVGVATAWRVRQLGSAVCGGAIMQPQRRVSELCLTSRLKKIDRPEYVVIAPEPACWTSGYINRPGHPGADEAGEHRAAFGVRDRPQPAVQRAEKPAV
ncbi:hypothetical protein [Burkholderia ambifaria]|uniref:hypothetical protein n=1 Tax=Burkholderia ambifaria TaxID=152480 RepID=UPI00158BA5C1|nr:hypothetical protein [Burkholderia ambifaria]